MDAVKQWTKGDDRVVVVYDVCQLGVDEVVPEGVRIACKNGARIALGTDSVDDLDAWEEEMQETHYLFPVYAYVHSGAALSLVPFHDPWDSGRSGTIAIPKDWGDEAKAWQAAQATLAAFTSWLNGGVFVIQRLRRCKCCNKWCADGDEPAVGGVVGLNAAEIVARGEFGVDDTWEEEDV